MPSPTKYASCWSVECRASIRNNARLNIQATSDHLIKFADTGSFAACLVANQGRRHWEDLFELFWKYDRDWLFLCIITPELHPASLHQDIACNTLIGTVSTER